MLCLHDAIVVSARRAYSFEYLLTVVSAHILCLHRASDIINNVVRDLCVVHFVMIHVHG